MRKDPLRYPPCCETHVFIARRCRSGVANRILEAKEKERAKGQDKGEGSSRKRKRYVLPVYPTPQARM